jgi:hypothetical protein
MIMSQLRIWSVSGAHSKLPVAVAPPLKVKSLRVQTTDGVGGGLAFADVGKASAAASSKADFRISFFMVVLSFFQRPSAGWGEWALRKAQSEHPVTECP